MKNHPGVIVASEVAMAAVCGSIYTKNLIVVFVVESVARIAGLF
jgi:hypothetical protein